jgi:hypothetical protein
MRLLKLVIEIALFAVTWGFLVKKLAFVSRCGIAG